MKPVVNGHKGITFNSGNISERNQQAAFRLYIGDCSLILLLLSYSLSLLNTFTSTFITGSFISVVCSFSEPELCFGYQWLNYAECAWKRPTFTQETLVELDPYVAKKKNIYIYIYIYIEMGCHFLFQGIFLIQESNLHLLHLLHWQVDSLPLSHQGSPHLGFSSLFWEVFYFCFFHFPSFSAFFCCCSLSQLCPTLHDPHGLQHARPPCLSPTAGVYSNSCPLHQWCHLMHEMPTISFSVVPFSFSLS